MNDIGNLIATFERKEGSVKVYDNGVVESFVKEGAYLDVEYLEDGKARLEKLGLGKKFYVINESGGFYRISREARELSASREYSDHIAAVAVVVSHVAIKFVFDMYMMLDKPHTPTKAFTHKESAREWLLERMEVDVLKAVG
jgi:hypothetical protein